MFMKHDATFKSLNVEKILLYTIKNIQTTEMAVKIQRKAFKRATLETGN